jgi:hypothetical protein
VFKARYKNKSDKTKNLQPENLKLEKEVENPISYDTNKPTEEEATRTKGNLNRLKKGLSIKH